MKNKKHQQFADVYLSNGLNATEAYQHVYKVKNYNAAKSAGARLLNNTKIQQYIEEHQQALSYSFDLNKEAQLIKLKHIYTQALNLEKPNYSIAIKAIQIQNQMLGFYNQPKAEEVNKSQQNLDLSHLTDEELHFMLEIQKKINEKNPGYFPY